MKEMNIFEVAVKERLRFPFRGLVSAEDLFDLNVQQLDGVFKELNAQVKQSNEESLLDVKSKEDTNLETMIEIVKQVVTEKLEARKAVQNEKANAEKKQKLMAILNDKQDEAYKGMSPEEIRKMIDDLG